MLRTMNQKVGLFLMLLSLGYLYLSYRLPSYPYVPVDADVLPNTLGIILFVLSIFLFFSKSKDENEERKKLLANKQDIFMLLIVAAFIFLYTFLLERIGFIITTILFLFITTRVLGYKRHLINLIIAITIPVVFYFIFNTILKIALPSGLLPF